MSHFDPLADETPLERFKRKLIEKIEEELREADGESPGWFEGMERAIDIVRGLEL